MPARWHPLPCSEKPSLWNKFNLGLGEDPKSRKAGKLEMIGEGMKDRNSDIFLGTLSLNNRKAATFFIPPWEFLFSEIIQKKILSYLIESKLIFLKNTEIFWKFLRIQLFPQSRTQSIIFAIHFYSLAVSTLKTYFLSHNW